MRKTISVDELVWVELKERALRGRRTIAEVVGGLVASEGQRGSVEAVREVRLSVEVPVSQDSAEYEGSQEVEDAEPCRRKSCGHYHTGPCLQKGCTCRERVR